MFGCKGWITLGAIGSHIQNKEITFCHVFVQLLLIAVDIRPHFDVVFEYMYSSTNHIYAPVFFADDLIYDL